MKFLFHLGHPAHFHLFKNTIKSLLNKGYKVDIIIKKKDILDDLLDHEGLSYRNLLPKGRHDSKTGIFWGMLKADIRLLIHCFRNKINIMAGTSYAISHVGKILGIPSINVNEDDWDVVPLYSKFSYPWASSILAPTVTRIGKWKHKSIGYSGYHELTYLHPQNFSPDKSVVSKYLNPDEPFFLIRFAKLTAHHDKGISGINTEVALKIISTLKPYGRIFITSETHLSTIFEKYRLTINPLDIHHVMAFSKLFIGDSQTMSAEAGILGVPFIRFNDFVGRISYLDELELKYGLGFGFRPVQIEEMLAKLKVMVGNENIKHEWIRKRDKMLSEKINVSSFLTWFIENYPGSVQIMKENPDYQYNFR